MFFLVDIETKILVPPEKFNSSRVEYLISTLKSKFEWKQHQTYGYVLIVKSIKSISKGQILKDSNASFKVKFEALVYHPLNEEVVDGIVCSITNVFVEIIVGPARVAISWLNMPKCMNYTNNFDEEDENNRIERDGVVRFKIAGFRKKIDTFNICGVINDDYLGPI